MINFNSSVLFLAPLAGFSDPPLRGVVKKFGCDVTVSEMISSNALVFENEKTLKMLERNELEKPYIVQIVGSDEEVIKKSVEILNSFDFIDGIDLNCGCPVPKVVKQNAGSALLLDLDKFQRIISIIKKTSNKKYTSVKFRLGFNDVNVSQIAIAAQNSGADYVCIHGRTRAGGYSAKVDYNAIAKAKESVKIPVIANGDIDANNFEDVLKITNANGVMIGRASIGKPWVFYEIKHKKTIDNDLKKEIILCHFNEMIKHYKEQGVKIFRKHLHEYSKGYNNASEFRQEINTIVDEVIMRDKIENFF